MEENKLLSVIVPVYNVENYLDRCMESIVNQTYKNLEIILVDDGSPDRCPEKCEEWAKRDSRIKVVHKKNAGLGLARNSGLEVATGEYVAFVDSDDWLEPDMYKELMHEAIEHDLDCVYCGFRQQLPSQNFVDYVDMSGVTFRDGEVSELSRRFVLDFSHEPLHFSVWHGVYRLKLIDFKFVSEREYMSEDLPFTLMFLQRCRSFSYLPKALYNYVYNAKSLSRTYNESTFKRALSTAGLINEIYRGTEHEGAGNAYAFCQVYFLMRFPIMKSKISLRRKYQIFKKIIQDEAYGEFLLNSKNFVFRKGIKYRLLKSIYNMHRKKRVLLNFLTIVAVSMKKG